MIGDPALGSQRYFNLAEAKYKRLRPFRRNVRVLFFADDRHPAGVVQDHIQSVLDMPGHSVTLINSIHDNVTAGVVKPPDLIVIHYSIFILGDYYLPPHWRNVVCDWNVPVVQIIQDEYRHVIQMQKRMGHLGVRAVLSSLVKENLPLVYNQPEVDGTCFYSCFPGYIPDRLLNQPVPTIADRPLDVVYRGRILPYKQGRLAQKKTQIGAIFKTAAKADNLKTDIEWDEKSRIYGQSWDDFLESARATLGVEGGATIFDFNDDHDDLVDAYQLDHPSADFEEIWENVLEPFEGNVNHATITPKLLEAIAAKTALVLYPGKYRGVLQPDKHYIPLMEDGSNYPQVLARLKDTEYLQNLVDSTYQDIMSQPELRTHFYSRQLAKIVENVDYHERKRVGFWRRRLKNSLRYLGLKCKERRDKILARISQVT